MRVSLQPAYVLHTRNYRDTSLLVEFLTPNYGRVSGVVRGVCSRGKQAKQRRSQIQPFMPLLISWSGNTELKTIINFERNGVPITLVGPKLFSAMYVNEVLTRLLQHYEECIDMFCLYEQVLIQLKEHNHLDVVLRKFEIQLLEYLGYGFNFVMDTKNSQPILADSEYQFDSCNGFIISDSSCYEDSSYSKSHLFKGADIISIKHGEYTESVRKSAKRLCRLALAQHLGNKPLKSRELFS